MSEQELELPKGWVSSSVIEICEKSQYGWTTSSQPNGNLKFLRTADITSGQIDWSSVPFCKNEPKDVKKYLLNDGDIVISRAGSVGFSSLINKPQRAVFASYLIRFRPLIETKFFAYFLQSPFYWSEIHEKSLGNTLANVNATRINQIKFLLPPLNEQKRIVSKIEELFSKIDSTKQSLEQTKLQLEQYRQSLLKSAFEGKIPSAKIIFEKSNWEHTTYDEISKKITYGFTNPMPDSTNGPWKITATNIKNNRIQYDDARKTDLKSYQKLITEKSRPKKDTILITKDGTLGNTAIVDKDNICINQSVASIEPNQSKVLPKFLMFSLQRPMVKQFIEKYKRATTIAHISITDLAKWNLNLPLLNEQQEIVSQIEQGFSLIENTQNIVNSTLQTLQTMKMSVLKQAFEGKLVPQDPNDEPAHILLDKIKSTKDAQPTKKRKAKNVK